VMKIVAIQWLHDGGIRDYDGWVGFAGLLILLPIGRLFMGWMILECQRGWPQAFRGDRTKWPFR